MDDRRRRHGRALGSARAARAAGALMCGALLLAHPAAHAEPCEPLAERAAARLPPGPWTEARLLEICEALPAPARTCLDALPGHLPDPCPAAIAALPSELRDSLERATYPPTTVGDAAREPGRAVEILGAAGVAGSLLLLLTVAAQLALARRQGRALGGVAPRDRALAALVILAGSAWSWWAAPHGPWHTNQHGLERVAALLDGVPAVRGGLSALHGTGWFHLVRPLHTLLGDPWAAMLVLFAAEAWLLFRLAHALRGPAVAHLALAFLAFHPIHLRLAVTEDMAVPANVAWLAGLVGLTAWSRAGGVALLVPAAGWIALAMITRIETLVSAPWAGLLLVLHLAPGRLREAARSPAAWLVVAGTLGLLAPRLLEVARLAPDLVGMGRPMDEGYDLRRAVPFVALALWLPLAARTPAGRRLPPRAVVAADVIAMLAVGGLAAALLLADDLPGGWLVSGPYHAALDLRFSPPTLPLAACLGVVAWARGGRAALASWWLLALIPPAQLSATVHDAISTYLRTAPGALWLLALAAGEGVHTLAAALPPRLRALGLPAVLATALPWADVVTSRYDKQELGDLVARARDALPEQAVVATLGPDDLPEGWDPARGNTGRGRPSRWLGEGDGRVVVGLSRLPFWVGRGAPVYVLRTPACYGIPLERGGEHGLVDDVRVPMEGAGELLDEGPVLWPAGLPRDAALEQARCREVASTWRLTPVFEHSFRPRRSGSEYEALYHPSPTVGLYRVDGPR